MKITITYDVRIDGALPGSDKPIVDAVFKAFDTGAVEVDPDTCILFLDYMTVDITREEGE